MTDDLQRHPVIAVDTESNSLFAYRERVCLIQFSTPTTDYIVDTLALYAAGSLGPVFADPNIEKVFHGADYDVSTLRRDFGFEFANLFDTMIASRILGIKRFGLGDLLLERFNVTLDKRMQRHDWGRRPLKPEELAYARLDTHYLLPLRDQLLDELGQRRREREAREAFARVAQATWSRKPFDPECFWRVKGACDLDDVGRGILKALVVWREEYAGQKDRPPFKVLSDETLVRLAKSRPTSRRGLRSLPGLRGPHMEGMSDAILAAIARGERDPQRLRERPMPDERPDPAVLERFESLRRWRKERAAARDVEPDVLISNSTLMAIARRAPATLETLHAIEDLGECQFEEFGAELLAAQRQRPDAAADSAA